MNARRTRHIVGALFLGILLGTPLAFSQAKEAPPQAPMQHQMMHHQHEGEAQPEQGDMPAKCKAMMQEQQQMMQRCQMMGAKLDELTAAMNAASGQEKVEAMSALLNELVKQRKAMHTMMMQMHKGMMSGMMGEMSEGAKPKCRMMQEMMKQKEGASAEGEAKTPER